MEKDFEYFQKSADFVKSKIAFTPEIGIILGTALGGLADEVTDAVIIPYADIPNFLISTAPTHAGKLILGTLAGKKVACMAGRFHYYEGYSFEQLTAAVRLFKNLGTRAVIQTNAAGAINKSYHVGDVMIIRDHINLVGVSPTRGKNIDEFGNRFFDVTDMYTKTLREIAVNCAKQSSLNVHEGVYYYFAGPQFETPSEIKAARLLGGDAAGMSTVPEALTAAHCGMPMLALSLMTNMAAGVLDQPISGDEVDATARRVAEPFRLYVKDILANL